MRIGSRITLTTVTLVMATLGIYSYVTLRTRRAEVKTDLERQSLLVGDAIQVALEAAVRDGRWKQVSELVARWQGAEPSFAFTYIDLEHSRPGLKPPGFTVPRPGDSAGADDNHAAAGDQPPPYVPPAPDPTRAQRLQHISSFGRSYGEHVSIGGRHVFALAVPVRNPDRQVVGAIELIRDEEEVERALKASVESALYAIASLGIMLAGLVWLSSRRTISNPLERLVEAIDDVTHGDLGRVILRERDDEVGDLAERFNEMTGSLRDARKQILDGVDAKLALEARLRHSEKLATIGQLAAGIAHEVGTPLNVIGGRARTMEKKSSDPAEVAKNAGIIAAQTQRITRIIQQLLDFARRPVAVRQPVDLHSVAKDCLDFLEHQLEANRVVPRLGAFRSTGDGTPAAPLILGNPDQLQQVCLNLCLNAIQAMPEGGELAVGTSGVSRRRPGLDVAPPGRYVVLDIADTGVGIPEADRDRIFEPFYSTKPASADGADVAGTGLGLAVSAGIVEDHGGWVEIDSRAGGGTVFRVFLPAVD